MTELSIQYPAEPGERLLTESDRVACQAFALCDRPATGGYPHPILGAVLSCERCASKLDETLESVSVTTIER